MNRPLLIVGDALLDVDLRGQAERLAPDAPVPVVDGPLRDARPGGAALAACLAAADGRRVCLVTALGADEASAEVRRLLAGRVRLVELPLDGTLSTKTRVLASGAPVVRLDSGDGRAAGPTEEALTAVAGAGAVLVSDYGRGTADVLRDALAEAAARRPLVWDPHPRGGAPVAGARLVTPSQSEARTLAAALADGDGRPAREPGRDAARAGRHAGPEARSRAGHAAGSRQPAEDAARLVRAWGVGSVAVTLGERGALLSHGDRPLLVSTPWRASGDPCGAGDRFATAAAGLLADGVLPEAAVQGAVAAATRYVEEGGVRCVLRGGPPADAVDRPARHAEDARAPDAFALAAAVRARGGTVVAAGGCFDLLHAGHITLLEAARRAGDCLIVCVNSDASVRRRKGAGRPLVPAADRVRVLTALGCVDAVAVFAEDTPESLLRELRPDVWAKGADYGVADLPEAALLESWGGQVVLLPYLDGRSTSVLAERAARAETRP